MSSASNASHSDAPLREVNQEVRFNIISNFPLFANQSKESINALAALMSEVRFKAGDSIVRENDLVDSFFLIVHGKAEVLKENIIHNEHAKIILATLTVGDSIGLSESSFFSLQGRRTASVVALSDVLLLRLDISSFNSFIESHPDFDESIKQTTQQMLKMDFIKQTSPFTHLNNDSIYSLSQKVQEVFLPANTIVFNKDDIADSCYLIRSGQIEIFSLNMDGTEQTLATLKSSELLGEAALLSQTVRNASARTSTDCSLLIINNELLAQLFKKSEPFSQSFMGLLVKRFHPIKNKNVTIYEHITKDKQYKRMLHNTDLHQYFRLSEEAWFIWQQLDGIQTVQDITFIFYKKYDLFVPEMICNLLFSWSELGFVTLPTVGDVYVYEEQQTFWQRVKNNIKKITHLDYAFTHTDNWLTKVYQNGIFLFFTWPCQILLLALIVIGFASFILSYEHVIENISTIKPHYWFLLFLIFPINFINVILHELGHAFTAKKFGHKIQRFGIGWYGMTPIAYTDTSELWVAEQIPRIAVDIAGIYVELVIAGCLALLSSHIENLSTSVFLWIFSLAIYFSAFKNLSPIREYDGYSLIMNILDYPRLRKVSINWLVNILPQLFTTTKVFKEHKAETIYWVTCVIYLLISTFILFLIFQLLFIVFSVKFILGIHSTYFSLLFAFFLLLISIRGIWKEAIQYRTN